MKVLCYQQYKQTLDSRGLSDDEDDDELLSLPQLRGFKLGKKDILDDELLPLFSLEEPLLRLDRPTPNAFLSISGLSSFLLLFLAGRFGGFFLFKTSLSLLTYNKHSHIVNYNLLYTFN